MKHKVNPLQYNITFNTNGILHITLETERLIIRSVIPKDESDCIQLLGDPVVMKKFATGVAYEAIKVKERLNIWTNGWKNHDPFGVYTMVEKKSGEFIGISAIGHSSRGEAELSGAIHSRFWAKCFLR